jgi:Xaa-Pro aminopeptidase
MSARAGQGPSPSALAARRTKLTSLAPAGGLLFAGEAVPRNYAANTFAFRASSHFLYFAGVGIPGAALLVREGASVLLLPEVPEDDALWHGAAPSASELAERTGLEVASMAQLRTDARVQGAGLAPAFDARMRDAQLAALGRAPTLAALGGADLALARAIVATRLVHDSAAIAELRAAADATVTAHRRGMAMTTPGKSEWEIVAAMEYAFTERGFGVSYQPIVTTHGEVLHHHGHEGTLKAGDLLLADVGAESSGGFAGDVTRTWPVNGRFSATQRALYEVVLEAQRRATEKVAPGVRYRDVHLEASAAIAEGLVNLGILRGDPAQLVADGVHALFFPHGVGHLLGLDVHDMEDLGDLAGYAEGRARSKQFGLSYLRLDRDLEAGMAVTIEPGFYQVPAILEHPKYRSEFGDRVNWGELRKFSDVRGIRIEDDVLVTTSGREVLTAGAPKTIAEVEGSVGR